MTGRKRQRAAAGLAPVTERRSFHLSREPALGQTAGAGFVFLERDDATEKNWFTRKGVGCISMPIQVVKTGILVTYVEELNA